MRSRTLVLAAAGLAAGLVLVALGWAALAPLRMAQPSLVGRAAPNLVVRTFDGEQISLEGLRGRPLVLNFWASWCVPCRQESGVLSDAARVHGTRVGFLGVNVRDTEAAARTFVQQTGPAYPVGDVLSGSTGAYGLERGLPETFFIDRRGMVVAHTPGALTNVALEGYLRQLGWG